MSFRRDLGADARVRWTNPTPVPLRRAPRVYAVNDARHEGADARGIAAQGDEGSVGPVRAAAVFTADLRGLLVSPLSGGRAFIFTVFTCWLSYRWLRRSHLQRNGRFPVRPGTEGQDPCRQNNRGVAF